jgi:hypothetical protein
VGDVTGKRVIAKCPFMSSYAARHPEYGALLDLGLGPGSFLIAPMVEGLHGASLRAVRPDRAADI